MQEGWQAQGRGDHRSSIEAYRQALKEAHAFGENDARLGQTFLLGARSYQVQGSYDEAEPLYQRALSILEKSLGPQHRALAIPLAALGLLYMVQGRIAEAGPLYQRAVAISEKDLGPENVSLTVSLGGLAAVHQAQGRFAEAERMRQRAHALIEQRRGPEHPDVAFSLTRLGTLYVQQGRHAEAEQVLQRALPILEKAYGSEDRRYTVSLGSLGLLYQKQGRFAQAELLYQRVLAVEEKVLGPEHPSVATALAHLAAVYQAQNSTPQALQAARRSTNILATRFGSRVEFDGRGVVSEQRIRSQSFERHASLAYESIQSVPAQRNALLGEALEAAQLARASDTAEQLARMAARQAAGSDRLSDAVRKRQDLKRRWEEVDKAIIGAISKPAAQRNPAHEAQLREQQQATRTALIGLDAQIEQEFPQYRELTNPQPLKLEAVQGLLTPDEALIATLSMNDATLIWVVRSGAADLRSVTITRTGLSATAQRLRRQLDLSSGDPNAILSRAFDVASAHDLYRQLLAPFEQQLEGVKHLIVVPDGALQSLPLAVLVTEAPSAPIGSIGDHADVAWLAKKYAITTLPSVGSLRALRTFAKTAPAPDPFSGFGDPLLQGGKDAARNASSTAFFSRGAVADVDAVRKLARLPESADELRAIASALKAPADQLHLGSAASEARVKQLDLSRFRNVAFATHGLMAGEFTGLAEPALVLTPPMKGSELDDGLLTASEIAQLKLNADWVILSACNTAAPDGTPGAEGLSGLAKAFFYAGARSLLVSHWAVDSGAAVALTTRMFEENAKGAPKAEALRRSMLALMQTKGKPHYAHPAFWAPFVVVGEGAR